MSNLNSQAFLDEYQTTYSDKVLAETYMQIYQYAAEDFPSHPDLANYIKELVAWMKSVDKRLAQQMALISKHTHSIPPHSHPKSMHPPVPLTTLIPRNASSISWSAIPYPQFVNTTLTPPNMSGNFVVTSIASEGTISPKKRRAKAIPLTMRPLLSPSLKASLDSIAKGGTNGTSS